MFGTAPLVSSRGGRRERSGWGGWRRIFLDEKAACLLSGCNYSLSLKFAGAAQKRELTAHCAQV